jgi:hypothetical protein
MIDGPTLAVHPSRLAFGEHLRMTGLGPSLFDQIFKEPRLILLAAEIRASVRWISLVLPSK